jgi:hypothetical protein
MIRRAQPDTPALDGNLFTNETRMNDTTLEAALRIFKQLAPTPTSSEYEREQQRIRANYERLKAERLAREAAANKPSLSLIDAGAAEVDLG